MSRVLTIATSACMLHLDLPKVYMTAKPFTALEARRDHIGTFA